MSDLTRYRVPPGHMSDAEVRTEYGELYNRGGFRYIKDTTLQDIAEAWNEWFDIDEGPTVLKSLMRSEWMDFAALLDALEGTDEC